MRRAMFLVTLATVIALAPMAARQGAPAGAGAKPAAAATGPVVVLETAKGAIEIETYPDSPKSLARFLELAKAQFYRGLRFHWVQPGVIQIGDPLSRDMTKQENWGNGGSGPNGAVRPVGVAEPSKRPMVAGVVGLAYRTDAKPESADSQIFILRGANPALNGKYAVIGRVTKGMDVVGKIEKGDAVRAVTVR